MDIDLLCLILIEINANLLHGMFEKNNQNKININLYLI